MRRRLISKSKKPSITANASKFECFVDNKTVIKICVDNDFIGSHKLDFTCGDSECVIEITQIPRCMDMLTHKN